MTKRKSIQKLLPETAIIFLLLFYVTGCKESPDPNNDVWFQIDITDTTYHNLIHISAGFYFPTYNVKVVNADGGLYAAAEGACPRCGTILAYKSPAVGNDTWGCNNCGASWYADGSLPTSSLSAWRRLKIYTVSRSGHILSVHQ